MNLGRLSPADQLLAALPLVGPRLLLSRAKHRSLAGHSRMAKRLARWIPGYTHTGDAFFTADGASDATVARRKAGFAELAQQLQAMAPRSLAATAEARPGLPDLQLTSQYRVPYPFSEMARAHLPVPSFWAQAQGSRLIDLDGNSFHDLTGSYGVNLFGVDFYRQTMAEGAALGASLGPVLGGYHPCVLDNLKRLQALSGHEAVSFHMSGTEAVMQAVRLARYHTGRRKLVRFCGAYHGWWDDVQPGPGNPMPPGHVYTLRDMDERSLLVLRRRRDIACVLVNPIQAMHPNRNAPGDTALVTGRHNTTVEREAYARWLQRLREVCTECGIALIFDEVFLGFRLAPGGAQAYYGVQADLVTYGKTLGGGFPVGVVCGGLRWMQRYRNERPADLCFARGTFNAHPYVMGAMNAFLRRLDSPEVQRLYDGMDERWQAERERFNRALTEAGVPVRLDGLSTVWSVNFLCASRYHWMLQFYLRRHRLALSWVGSGRLVFGLQFTPAELAEVRAAFVQACRDMQRDGWWDALPDAGRSLRRRLAGEIWNALRR
ncbi:MAG: glutamate-1-semialdehyde 2,1-aminomutase [Comamonadaceae bacterium]|nr:glutamate-1-semialdehyde 2,1-aminomutase [Comamonadaceae bacterium]